MSALKKPDPSKHLRLAVAAQSAGDHARALQHAEEVLAQYPSNPQALLMAAQSCLMLDRHEAALKWSTHLLAHQPRHAMALNNRGVALDLIGRHEQALEDFVRARSIEPHYEDARLNEARCLQRLQRHDDAATAYQAILAMSPSHVEAAIGLGACLRATGHQHQSLAILSELIQQHHGDGMAWHALGDAYLDNKQWQEAVDAYGQASTLQPGYALTYANCAKALRELGQHADALLVTDAAIQLDPNCLPARRNRVVFLLDLNRYTLAIEACAQMLRLSPEDALTHNNLGFALNALKQYEAALDAFQTASRHDPKMAVAWVNQACTLEMMNRHEEALEACEQALRLEPNYPNLPGRLGHARLYMCDWREATELRQRLLQSMDEGHAACDPFRIISFSDKAQDQQKLARRWHRDLVQPVDPSAWSAMPAVRHGRRIRVGYFSADFHHHATTLLMARMLELHDHSSFEIIGISFGPPREDAMRARLRRAFDSFHDVMAMDDDRAAALARELQLDIAVDLKGYTMDHRIGLFQRRVAPVQISYLGFPGTLGAPFMDYILADHTLIPDELKVFYDEKVIRIPGTYQANDDTRRVAVATPNRSSLGLPEHGFVFCCFNNNYKITPEVFDIWMRLLDRTPGSVLWLLADSTTAQRNLQAHATTRGIDPSRLVFAPRVSWDEHLARQAAADLFLDTLPCNAHTTASDALRMGLPVLTCMGTAFASRVAASLLRAQGLDELVTSDLQQYEEKALQIAQDPILLSRIRRQTEAAVTTGALLASEAHVAHVEAAYREVVERAWNGLPPDDVDITARPTRIKA